MREHIEGTEHILAGLIEVSGASGRVSGVVVGAGWPGWRRRTSCDGGAPW